MKKIFTALLVIAMVASLTACGSKTADLDNPESKTTPSEQTEYNVIGNAKSDIFVVPNNEDVNENVSNVDHSSPALVATAFVKGLATHEFNTVISTLDVENKDFVFAEDIAFEYNKSDFAEITKYANQSVYLTTTTKDVNQTNDHYIMEVSLVNENDEMLETFTINVVYKGNKWLVENDNFYVKDYYISCPGNTKLYINGVEVADDFIEGECGHSSLKTLYKIPYIGNTEKEFKAVCEQYEEIMKATPEVNNKNEALVIAKHLKDEELQEALNAVKELWNNLYKDYSNGVSKENAMKYFAENIDEKVYDEICKGFEEIRKGSSGYKDINHKITVIEKRSDGECFYITNDVMVLNFQYQIDWKWDFALGGPESGRRLNHILLQKTENGYKIYEVSAMDLFNDVSGNEW